MTYRSQGPKIDWAYLKKLRPAIHVIRALTSHMELEFGTLVRGKKQTIPKRDIDVPKLRKSFHIYHQEERGRVVSSKEDRTDDYSNNGWTEYMKGKKRRRWVDGRTFVRSTREVWGDEESSSEDEESTTEPTMEIDETQ